MREAHRPKRFTNTDNVSRLECGGKHPQGRHSTDGSTDLGVRPESRRLSGPAPGHRRVFEEQSRETRPRSTRRPPLFQASASLPGERAPLYALRWPGGTQAWVPLRRRRGSQAVLQGGLTRQARRWALCCRLAVPWAGPVCMKYSRLLPPSSFLFLNGVLSRAQRNSQRQRQESTCLRVPSCLYPHSFCADHLPEW